MRFTLPILMIIFALGVSAQTITETLQEAADDIKTAGNIQASTDSAIRSSERLKTAAKDGNLSTSASSTRNLGNALARTGQSANKLTDSSFGTDAMGGINSSLKNISNRLSGASQMQTSHQRLSNSFSRIQAGIKSGNLSRTSSGLRSASRNIRSYQSGTDLLLEEDKKKVAQQKKENATAAAASTSQINVDSSVPSSSTGSSRGGSSRSSGRKSSSSGNSGSTRSTASSSNSTGSNASSNASSSNKSDSTQSSSNTSNTATNAKSQQATKTQSHTTSHHNQYVPKQTGPAVYNTGSKILDNVLKDSELKESAAITDIQKHLPDEN